MLRQFFYAARGISAAATPHTKEKLAVVICCVKKMCERFDFIFVRGHQLLAVGDYLAGLHPLEHVCAGRVVFFAGESGGGELLRQAAAVVLLRGQHPAHHWAGVCDRVRGQPGIWMECLELHKPAAQPDGTGLYRLHRAVVFAERSGDRACLPGAPPPAGEKGDRIGALLSGVALGVAAAAAEGLGGAAAGKALIQRLGPRGGENLCKRLGVDVAQRDIAVRVEAAGHHCPVGQHAELVAQSVAEHLVGKVGLLDVRPGKFFGCLEIYPVSELHAGALFQRLCRVKGQCKKLPYLLEDIDVALVGGLEDGAVAVPQPQHADGLDAGAAGCCTEGEHCLYIFFQRLVGVVGLKAVQRDADPVEGRGAKQQLLPLFQKGAVGGQRHLQPRAVAQGEDFSELRVQQRLTHQV